MSHFDDVFGDLFDFDGDGETSFDEGYLGYMMLHEDAKGWESPAISLSDDDDDDLLDGFDDDGDFDGDDDGFTYIFSDYGGPGQDNGPAPGPVSAVRWNIREEALPEDCREAAAYLKGSLERLAENLPITISLTMDEGQGEGGEENGPNQGPAGAVHWNIREEVVPECARESMAKLKASMERLVELQPITISLTMNEDNDGDSDQALAELAAIKEEDYPHIRQYQAARQLCGIQNGLSGFADINDKEGQDIVSRCQFILHSPDILAARYLTAEGDFRYAQAIVEHFDLPVQLPLGKKKRTLSVLLGKIAKEDTTLALGVWKWCVKVFGPYSSFLSEPGDLYNNVLENLTTCPPALTLELVKFLDREPEFCQALILENPEKPLPVEDLAATALWNGLDEAALAILAVAIVHPKMEYQDIGHLIAAVIRNCCGKKDNETMKLFTGQVYPGLKALVEGEGRQCIPAWDKLIAQYSDPKNYHPGMNKYAGQYTWRNGCPKGTEYGLSPQYYATAKDYAQALREAKKKARINAAAAPTAPAESAADKEEKSPHIRQYQGTLRPRPSQTPRPSRPSRRPR